MEVMLPLPGASQGWPHALGKLSNDNHWPLPPLAPQVEAWPGFCQVGSTGMCQRPGERETREFRGNGAQGGGGLTCLRTPGRASDQRSN